MIRERKHKHVKPAGNTGDCSVCTFMQMWRSVYVLVAGQPRIYSSFWMVKIPAREPTLNTNPEKKVKITDNKQTELLPLLISIQQPSPDFACSRRGLGKGCRCRAVATDLKMVYIPCYVSITTLTCLRERLTNWGRKRHVATEILFAEQRWKRATQDIPRKHLAKIDCIPSDHIISNYVLL